MGAIVLISVLEFYALLSSNVPDMHAIMRIKCAYMAAISAIIACFALDFERGNPLEIDAKIAAKGPITAYFKAK